ncbi:MAG: FkbM family methyltransferase [Haliscomenobacter sp.]|nr:FkbM family methyltransferase [Haliscomenobacter sp.]
MIRMIQVFGLLKGFLFWWNLKVFRSSKIQIPGIKYPVFLRKGIFDSFTLREIFLFRHYEFQWPSHFPEPKHIIDAGANVGFTSIFFANKYPNAAILSLEPEASNFNQLKLNTGPYPAITAIQHALWGTPAHIVVRDMGYGQRGFLVEEVPKGFEKNVFEKGFESWLPLVKVLVIELHDRMVNGTSNTFFKAISKYNFSVEILGDNLIFVNENFEASPR